MAKYNTMFLSLFLVLAMCSALCESFSSTGYFGANGVQSYQRTHSQQQRSMEVDTSLSMTVLTYNGKKKNFKAGSPLKKAAAALGVKPKYSCKKGDCASCTLNVGGTRIKACIGKVPPEPRLKSLQEKGLAIG
mmetsp:Transcript_24770/g.30442  ORF Transcript_24770/g.30442 Transcript_24770/m.30442 type:complete len:133 (+) Transcript_24770:118-516(+)